MDVIGPVDGQKVTKSSASRMNLEAHLVIHQMDRLLFRHLIPTYQKESKEHLLNQDFAPPAAATFGSMIKDIRENQEDVIITMCQHTFMNALPVRQDEIKRTRDIGRTDLVNADGPLRPS